MGSRCTTKPLYNNLTSGTQSVLHRQSKQIENRLIQGNGEYCTYFTLQAVMLAYLNSLYTWIHQLLSQWTTPSIIEYKPIWTCVLVLWGKVVFFHSWRRQINCALHSCRTDPYILMSCCILISIFSIMPLRCIIKYTNWQLCLSSNVIWINY